MHSFKWILIGLCTAIIAVCLSSCESDLSVDIGSETKEGQFQSEDNIVLPIYDKNGNLIETIETYGSIIQTDTGILYGKLTSDSTDQKMNLGYFFLDFASGETSFIGIIKDYRYHAAYDVIYRDGHVYETVSIGNGKDISSQEHYLYDIDLNNRQMNRVSLDKDIVPYSSMTMKDGYVYVSTLGKNISNISRYDTENHTLTKLRSFSAYESDNKSESIRHIYSDDNFVYLLRLTCAEEPVFNIYVDICDSELKTIHSVDVTDILGEYVLEGIEKGSELKQLVSDFFWKNGYLYYENFSITRALVQIECPEDTLGDTKTAHIFDADIGFCKAITPEENDIVIFYEECRNTIYGFETNTGEMRQYSFFSDSENEGITYISKNTNDDLIIIVMDGYSTERDREKMYVINLSELKEDK